ncbi:MAG: parvulin-like peptidyl-prolyl isomerase [Bacteroidetes bacterium]|nr:parvulin-like peptidyl-prolyl isomerase [Bacteroidota bacterium]
MKRIKLIFAAFLLFSGMITAQERVIDKIVAVVGTNPILKSELEAQYQQMLAQQEPVNENTRCKLLEDLLFQKLLLAQAQKDSLEVTEAQVEQELDRRMRYYLGQFGSEEKFHDFYGKSSEDYKAELKDNVRDLLLAQQMQGKITNDISVTPNEIRAYYNSIPKDSIPLISAEVEVGQIVKKPGIKPEAKKESKEFIERLRQRVLKGESFATLAALYSKDPGSASKGGLYPSVQRGQFVPEWDAWAFRLKPGEVSEVFETVYGYFFIQLVERRGEEVEARSLLYFADIDPTDLLAAKMALDTIYTKLNADTVTFAEAAARYSDDDETKHNGGLIVNPFTGSTLFAMDEIGQYDQNVAFAIDKIKIGEFTKPTPYMTQEGKQAYRILYLKKRTEPHIANLVDDYQKIQGAALNKKQEEAIQAWIKKKLSDNFVRIADDYKSCTFSNKWIN